MLQKGILKFSEFTGFIFYIGFHFCLVGLVIVLTVPALYERYEDQFDLYVMMGCRELQRLYVKLDQEILGKIRKWILEKRKLS